MNTLKQVMELSDKLRMLLDKNKGVLTLHFYDGKTITAKVKFVNTTFGVDKKPESIITTFTDDIYKTESYDFFLVKDIS